MKFVIFKNILKVFYGYFLMLFGGILGSLPILAWALDKPISLSPNKINSHIDASSLFFIISLILIWEGYHKLDKFKDKDISNLHE